MDTDNGEFNTYKKLSTIAHFTSLMFHQIKQNTAQSPYVTHFRLRCKLHERLATRQCSSIRQMLNCRKSACHLISLPRSQGWVGGDPGNEVAYQFIFMVGNRGSSLTPKHIQQSSCPELGLGLCFPLSCLSRHMLQTSQ